MKISKWKKELLFFLLALFGAGSSSIAVGQHPNNKFGTVSFESLSYELKNQFIYSVGASAPNGNSEIKPSDLVKNLSFYSSSIPFLIEGFAIQTAKQIFNGKLFESTKYQNGLGKLLQNLLKKEKLKIDAWLKNRKRRYSNSRIKKEWVQDENRYLTSLKQYLLSKIDETSINDYFKIEDHLLEGAVWGKVTVTQGNIKINGKQKSIKFWPLLAFFVKEWIKKYKAGFYVHEVVPYANKFNDEIKQAYQEKYKTVPSNDTPNYFFPDYERKTDGTNKFEKLIDDWKNGRFYYPAWYSLEKVSKDKEIIGKTKLLWINNSNDSHKNLALKILSWKDDGEKEENGSEEKWLSRWYNALSSSVFRWKREHKCENSSQENGKNMVHIFNKLLFTQKINPMHIFCLDKVNEAHPEFLLYKPDKSEYNENKTISKKILFYRNHEGFNLIYPIDSKIIESQNEAKMKILTNSHLSQEFKKFVKENFSHLLLRYRIKIKTPSEQKNGKKEKNTMCCCDEVIKNLLILLNLGSRLSDWNEIWKSYDIRKINNDFLSRVENSKYLNKLGTISGNPPEFLTPKLKQELKEISKLKEPVAEYMKKLSNYFSNELEAQEEVSNKPNGKYWTFMKVSEKTNKKVKAEERNCIKREVAEYLLERIARENIIKKFLSLPISFKSAMSWLEENSNQQNSSIQQVSSNLEKNYGIKNLLNNKFQQYFNNFLNETSSQKNNQQTPHLIKEILNLINQELILSELSEIPDTTIFNLLKKDRNDEQSSSIQKNPLENIENYLTLINLRKPNKNRLDEKLRILITVLYLMEDSFREYREWIRNVINKEGFGVYAFTLSWNRFCNIYQSSLDPMNRMDITSMWTPYIHEGDKEWDLNKFDPRQCIETSDRFSSTPIKKKLTNSSPISLGINFLLSTWDLLTNKEKKLSEEEMIGFKGILSEYMVDKVPKNIYDEVGKFLHKEGYINWEEIQKQIEQLQTNGQFYEFIKKLSKIHPSFETIFQKSKYEELQKDIEAARNVEVIEYESLRRKKELLNLFINENIFKEMLPYGINDQMIEITISPANRNKGRFQGLLKNSSNPDIVSYTFSSAEVDYLDSSSYLLQITTADIKDENHFYSFAHSFLTPKMLLQDLIKQARIGSLQAKAINHFLNRGWWANKQNVKVLRSSDSLIQKQFTTIIL